MSAFDKKPEPSGTLYVVATPIGNLEDMSPRACRILGEVSIVAAEDTRSARKLLDPSGQRASLLSYHEHNETQRLPALLARLTEGEDVAVISEAGVPAISDPGFRLVREAQQAGIRVVGIPGPCAAVTALSIAGFPTDRFLFLGFLPPKQGRRQALLKSVQQEPGTLVAYESPQRIQKTLKDVEAVLPGRSVALARELTKVHEEVLRGPPSLVVEKLEANGGERLRGEMTLLIAGRGHRAGETAAAPPIDGTMGIKEIAGQVARALELPSRDVYRALCQLREGRSTRA